MINASMPLRAAPIIHTAILILVVVPGEVDLVYNNFCRVTLYAVFVGVVTIGQPSFDGNFTSFIEVFLCQFRLLFPQYDLVPGSFGDAFTLTIFAIAVCSQAQFCEFLLVLGYFDLGCAAQETDQADAVV